ncbi:hypothetical protein [Dyella jiangningensis]|uniref:DOT1 domain-containing protein n=1 Tax=Dyella jiangningensis TaxID=1379159 RepID=A0A328P382_9GAMM|nr:hypothetical protein [Dyella jiangningensis]RAO76678.1 hypothetical protein CA260_01775 [Dyella jiangningensis]
MTHDAPLPPDTYALIDALEQNRSLEWPERLRERIRAMERLEEWIDDTVENHPLHTRAMTLHARLVTIQRQLTESIRADIRQGTGAHSLRRWSPGNDIDAAETYDHLDALFGDVLAFDEPSGEIAPLEADMVFYQPTPVRHVFDLVERAGITDDDVFVDLGSGLGHVPMLVSMLTGARCIGIEREQVYVDGARRSAEALCLGDVSFVAQDVREADLSTGTVFYLYTPFTGAILDGVLERLRREAQQRPIRLVTFGPCTNAIAAEHWLQPLGESNANRIAVFHPVGG